MHRYLLTFGFGLAHGLGFSGYLRELLPGSSGVGWSLFGFNVGVEIGQLLIVAPVVLVLAKLREKQEVFRSASRTANVVMLLVASFWTVQRVGALFA